MTLLGAASLSAYFVPGLVFRVIKWGQEFYNKVTSQVKVATTDRLTDDLIDEVISESHENSDTIREKLKAIFANKRQFNTPGIISDTVLTQEIFKVDGLTEEDRVHLKARIGFTYEKIIDLGKLLGKIPKMQIVLSNLINN